MAAEDKDEDDGPVGPMPVAGGGDESDSSEDAGLVGPAPPPKHNKRKRKRKRIETFNEQACLDALPCSELYERVSFECCACVRTRLRLRVHRLTRSHCRPSRLASPKSYMHRDVITHVAAGSKTDFIVTASREGGIKFWKKKYDVSKLAFEFVKVFRAHLCPVAAMSISQDGRWLVTAAEDMSAKIYDIASFDMVAMIKLHAKPTCVCWMREKASSDAKGGEASLRLAVALSTCEVHVVDHTDCVSTGENAGKVFKGHRSPVVAMEYSTIHNVVVSIDARGVIEYWRLDVDTGLQGFPKDACGFRYKTDTHLFELAKKKCTAVSLTMSPDENLFACVCSDARIRVFVLRTGKMKRCYDETLDAAQEFQNQSDFALEAIDFGRRFAIEKKFQSRLQQSFNGGADASEEEAIAMPNAVFDDSGQFIIYASLLGIKIINVHTNRVCAILGRLENTERFTYVALHQGQSTLKQALKSAKEASPQTDPVIFAAAIEKQRFYMFTRREPEDTDDLTLGRDIFNEKPDETLDDFLPKGAKGSQKRAEGLETNATIHTTCGDIHLTLFPNECSKTCENFITHSKGGYYNGVIFHRVIKGFMIQTGDPDGNGTGGESIWGEEFEDEFHESLRHDRPYTLSMANCGPNTNGSQFFITTVACPWLNDKHTVFGRVVKGMDVVYAIERSKTDQNDKPLEDIKIVNIAIS